MGKNKRTRKERKQTVKKKLLILEGILPLFDITWTQQKRVLCEVRKAI